MFGLFFGSLLFWMAFYVVGGGIHVSIAAAEDDLCRSMLLPTAVYGFRRIQ
jgi:hypothetical protein